MLARLTIGRRLPQILGVRYSTGGRTQGSVAASKEFGKREKGQEDSYVRQHEAAQLKKLAEQIKQMKSDVAELEKQAEDLKNQK